MPADAGPGLHLTTHEALSGIFGSISLAAWVFLLVPQLIENYKQGSAEGISLLFLTVWFIGDITNLAGAAWADLVPTVIALAVYFCFADFILITQCLYYNIINARRQRKFSQLSAYTDDSAEQPLLSRNSSNRRHSIGLPGSHRRLSSSASRRHRASFHRRESGLASIVEEDSGITAWIKNTMSILAVCTAGAAGWAVAWKTGVWSPAPPEDDAGSTNMAFGAQILGYFSAICYLGARIPQIVKNWRDQSCEGLSLLFFLLSLLGNLTYGAGILFHSLDKEYVLTNLPWLLGSLGTMVEDGIIFVQFHAYKDRVLEAAVT